MTATERMTATEWHTKCAKDFFNKTWDYVDKSDRTTEENDTMLHCAHASRFHWEQIGKPLNLARGEWMCSRVYAVLGRSEPALHHGHRCLEICEANQIGDFDLAFAYEALARGSAVAGNKADRERYAAKAREVAETVADKDNREHFDGDLATIPE